MFKLEEGPFNFARHLVTLSGPLSARKPSTAVVKVGHCHVCERTVDQSSNIV